MKNILFLTTANLSIKPRLLKEILTASIVYNVELIAFRFSDWSHDNDKEILKMIKIKKHYISATRKPFLNWFISSFTSNLFLLLFKLFRESEYINAIATNKRSFLLLNYLKKKPSNYNLIIARGLATLFPAVYYSQKNNIPVIFDIEDYHPGEKINSDKRNEIKRREHLLQKLLPKVSYFTYASPLIGDYTIKLLNHSIIPNNCLINNCFSETEFIFNENKKEKLQLVWFSQNINAGRGLELIVPALLKYKNKIELTLIGNLYQEFYDNFLFQYSTFIQILKPLSQNDLNKKICEFDIGLAIELNSADFNRDICLTNKIFSYSQAGLYIIATDTRAQRQFLLEHNTLGSVTKQTEEDVSNIINKVLHNKNEIRQNKRARFDYAKKLSWEIESKKLIEIWNNLL